MRLPPQVFAGQRPERSKLEPVTSAEHYFWKPRGGLWTSTYTPDAEHASDWIEWTMGEGFKVTDQAWVLTPGDARVAEIRTQDDLAELLVTYRLDVPSIAGLTILDALLDFEALASDYDALWMPSPWGERFTGDHALAMFFYALDSECTLWFRWCFHGQAIEVAKTESGGERSFSGRPYTGGA